MDGRSALVVGSIAILIVSVVLAFLGVSQAIVSAIISAVGTGTGLILKILERDPRQALTSSIPKNSHKFVINEAPTIGGKRREDFGVDMEEGETIGIFVKATEGRFSAGLFSETDFQLLNRSGKYGEEWYYAKRWSVTKRFRAKRKGTWYLVLWNEESYPLQVSVKVK